MKKFLFYAETYVLYILHIYTVCPRSSGPFYVVTYYIEWVTTSWTDSMNNIIPGFIIQIYPIVLMVMLNISSTVCPRSLDPIYIVIYNVNWEKTSWAYSKGIVMILCF